MEGTVKGEKKCSGRNEGSGQQKRTYLVARVANFKLFPGPDVILLPFSPFTPLSHLPHDSYTCTESGEGRCHGF
jgi:hypothetical protein